MQYAWYEYAREIFKQHLVPHDTFIMKHTHVHLSYGKRTYLFEFETSSDGQEKHKAVLGYFNKLMENYDIDVYYLINNQYVSYEEAWEVIDWGATAHHELELMFDDINLWDIIKKEFYRTKLIIPNDIGIIRFSFNLKGSDIKMSEFANYVASKYENFAKILEQ